MTISEGLIASLWRARNRGTQEEQQSNRELLRHCVRVERARRTWKVRPIG